MKIEHIAIWVMDLEKMKKFYLKFFDLSSNEKYYNQKKKFSSYFLSFKSGARIELMNRPDISELIEKSNSKLGFAHFPVSVGTKERVNSLTEKFRENGIRIIGRIKEYHKIENLCTKKTNQKSPAYHPCVHKTSRR